MVIILSLLVLIRISVIAAADHGSEADSICKYDAFASLAPGALPDSFFQDPQQIPALIRSLLQNASHDNLTWIRRLLAGNVEEAEFFQLLSVNNRSSACLYSLQPGERAYHCFTCASSPNSIQCAACFRSANHAGHDVKIIRAGGGGICDCGDSSSWAAAGFCSRHQGQGNVDEADISWLPEHTIVTFTSFLEAIIEAILHANGHYAIDSEIISGGPDFDYCAFLHNDDVHKFNDIITLLESISGLPERVGLNIALKIDHYGRAVFAAGSESHCQSLVEAFAKHNVGGSVEQRPTVLLCEERVVEALNIVTALCHQSDALRRLACDIVGQSRGSCHPHESYMAALMHASFIFPGNLESVIAPFFFELFISVAFKERLTLQLTQNYSTLRAKLTNAPQKSYYSSVFNYTAHLYAIPDLILKLCRSHNLLGLFLLQFQDVIRSQLISHAEGSRNESMHLLVLVMHDLAALVGNQGVCRYVYKENPDLIHLWLNSLLQTEGLDAQVRQTGVHVDNESMLWVSAFHLTSQLQSVSKLFLKDFSTMFVPGDLDRIFVPIFNLLLETSSSDVEERIDLGNGFSCPVYDISHQHVSMHFPFTRFLIELSARFCLATSCPMRNLFRDPSMFIRLVDNLMRSVAFVGHIRANIWVLNGNTLMQQVGNYERSQARDCMFEPDLLALQCSAVVMGPKAFLLMLSYRFLLHETFFPGQIAAPAFDSTIEESKILVVAEYFMQTLVAMVVERSRITVDKNWGLRREIVHWLVISDLTHSDLLFRLGMESPSVEVKQILGQVAHFVTPRDMESGKYQVRKEAVAEFFDAFFAKYSDSQRETATAAFASQNHGGHNLPRLPPYCPSFIGLYNLSVSLELYQILHQILSNSVLTSARLVESCLRLIGAGLRDAQSCSEHFPVDDFIRSLTFRFSQKGSVFELLCSFLRDDIDKTRGHCDYIRLLIDGIVLLSPLCRNIAQSLLSDTFALQQQQQQLAVEAEERRRRRDAARAAALGAMQNQIVRFSQANNESLQQVADIDESSDDSELHVCILCRSTESQQDMGLLAWMGRAQLNDLLIPPANRCRGRTDSSEMLTYVRECGHAMHFECFSGYMRSLRAKEAARQHYGGLFVIDLSKGEFVCPLCKSHGNTLLPILAFKSLISSNTNFADDSIDLKTWIVTSAPTIAGSLNMLSSDPSAASTPTSGCMGLFESRLGDFIPNRSLTELLAQSIVILEIQLRDDRIISEKQMPFLRSLIAIASQRLLADGVVDSVARSLARLSVSSTTSLQFLVECLLSFTLIGENRSSMLKMIRIGYMVLCGNCDRSEFNEQQFAYACSLNPSATRQELFTLPFLRQAAILLSALRPEDPLPNLSSYSALLQYFGFTESLVDLDEAIWNVPIALPLAYVKPSLAPLPQSFIDLFDEAGQVHCPRCNRKPVRPAVCLICGKNMCSSEDCGDGFGALSYHTLEHRGDQGLFLSVDQGSVLLICNGFSCEFFSPYLDEHGEEDIGLHRGRPLFLDADRFDKLHQLVTRLEIGSSVSRKRSYQSSLIPRNAI